MPRRPPVATRPPIRVSIVAIPEAMVSPVSGLFEAFKGAGSMAVTICDSPRGNGQMPAWSTTVSAVEKSGCAAFAVPR